MLYTEQAIEKRRKQEKNIKRILTVIAYIILIPILIYNFSLIIQSIINPNQTPSFFGIKSYVIISGSMEPELNIGDIVIVKESKELQEGDIISFREGQSIVTHRISKILVENGEKLYKTKGDNNNTEDSRLISDSLIEGKVIRNIHNIGKIAILLRGKTAIIIIILLLYIYIAYSGEIRKRKERRKAKRLEHERQKTVINN